MYIVYTGAALRLIETIGSQVTIANIIQ